MKLAWKNIVHDRVRFLVTVLGIAFAVFLMIFQGSLLAGFLQASSKLVDAAESDLWISPRGVLCFDFSAPLPKRLLEIAQGVPGVKSAGRVVTSFAHYRTPQGRHHLVALVGADREAATNFPLPYVQGAGGVIAPDSILIDQSNAALLDASTLPMDVEINHLRARVINKTTGFSSFLGSPYVFTSYPDAVRYLGLGSEESMYILARVQPGHSPEAVKRALQARLPEVDVWTHDEFSKRSQLYWVTQTGAGAAILTAAVLGFFIGLMIVSQTIYATTMEHLEEYATLKALGASRWFVARTVLAQALACGAIGCVLGLAATFPLVDAARSAIAWLYTPWWLPVAMIPPSLILCCLAAVISIRTALAVEPAKVFRA